MVKISRAERRFGCVEKRSLADANILERDLQEYIFNSHEAFCKEIGQPQLQIIAREVQPSENVDDRIDLLAVDEDGDLVIIELKRGSDKLQLLQAIGYAGMAAKLTAEKIRQEAGKLSREGMVSAFEDETLNRGQRILLVAEDYDYEVLAAADWLHPGVEIDCVHVELTVDAGVEYLTFVQIFPTPALANQARKRGRPPAAPGPYASWEDALADVSNKAAAEFFRRHLNTGLVEKLWQREINFPPRKIYVYLRSRYALVYQFTSRFPGDIKLWQSRIKPPEGIQEWTKFRENDSLSFRLSTAEEFAAFEKALKDSELKAAKWSNAPTTPAEAITA